MTKNTNNSNKEKFSVVSVEHHKRSQEKANYVQSSNLFLKIHLFTFKRHRTNWKIKKRRKAKRIEIKTVDLWRKQKKLIHLTRTNTKTIYSAWVLRVLSVYRCVRCFTLFLINFFCFYFHFTVRPIRRIEWVSCFIL